MSALLDELKNWNNQYHLIDHITLAPNYESSNRVHLLGETNGKWTLWRSDWGGYQEAEGILSDEEAASLIKEIRTAATPWYTPLERFTWKAQDLVHVPQSDPKTQNE